MENKIRDYFNKRIGKTIPVKEAYKEFIETNGINEEDFPKKEFYIKSHYTGLVRKKQVSREKYYVVDNHEDKSMF